MLYLKRLNYLLNRLILDRSYLYRSVLSNFKYRYKYIVNDFIENKKSRIIIYTLGKCGSTSVQFSLCNHLRTSRVDQVHFLSEIELKKLRKDQFASIHLRARQINAKLNVENPTDITFVTIIRNPFDRDISSFFQNRDWYKKFDINNANLEDYLINNADMSLNWIFNELIPYFGLNIKDFEYVPKNGLWIDLKSGSKLLVIRYENLKESLEYNYPGIRLFRLNSAEHKVYSKEKKAVENSFIVPINYKTRVESSLFYKLFYSE